MNKKQGKILIINDNNLAYLGGERESQFIIVNGVKKLFHVSVIQPGVFKEKISDVEVISLTKSKRMKYLIKNPIAFVMYIFKMSVAIRKISPDIIHTQSQVSFFIISLLKRFGMIKKSIITVHTDRGLYTKYNCFFQWLFQFSFRKLDVLITTTKFNGDQWKKANEKKHIKLDYQVIENTAGKMYEKMDESKIQDRHYLTVGFAGRMCDWKGWPLAKEICESSGSKISDLHYIMYVSCFDRKTEKQTREMFDSLREQLGNRFVGRINVPFHEMDYFYYGIDVYILTSWPMTESFGRTIVEAMSRKTAILTTNAGGAVEVVANEDNVHNTAEEFVQHLMHYDKNRDLLNSEKQNNFKHVHEKYSYKNNVDKHIELYRRLIG